MIKHKTKSGNEKFDRQGPSSQLCKQKQDVDLVLIRTETLVLTVRSKSIHRGDTLVGEAMKMRGEGLVPVNLIHQRTKP